MTTMKEFLNKALNETKSSTGVAVTKWDEYDNEYELKKMTMEDLLDDTPLPYLKTVFRGQAEEIKKYAKKNKLTWKNSKKFMFGGYFYDKKNGEAYLLY